MQVTVYLSDGGTLDVTDMDDASALDLRENLALEQPGFLTFDLDGSTVLVNRHQVVRIDFETGDA